ncbi:16S rRNA (cytosine(1402)-N(4))-methyltransferase RsmH [Acetobacter oeni]|uniref:Ribosomal RNA small subunit methyltransferase H n=1 Tax=Acetobacter oeni TaxID=304077 RepID=A0A511XI02_9PROT|nr:16S rRNA (cytosine(1402)-N(4))-methyltransferase RsmH [Acetobacter oeni]MBB3882509.1 16S rRNA (cytosine1402-N4)-methyltransferase [Acetobacter oeni]NHO18679.1 16S rRNA (cytosine(1402)-N(4))-methyltransferase RsmH [Acetobacter oeni]GBR11805.1 S-adenosyl-methyltransferase MraW [Acetobacter oeni LMG 21952]GEN62554.1 ribosomal RNA small subunit methyltransferase H [Acetobacter oeni]
MNAMTPSDSVAIPDHDPGHIPVMRDEVVRILAPADGEVYVDGTFGGGGYANAVLAAADCRVWGIDRDPDAIARGELLAARWGRNAAGLPRLGLLHGGFGTMRDMLEAVGVSSVDGVMLDLGVSSFQIDEADRGFSFRVDGPLDMRMEKAGRSAADIVNTASEAELADIFHYYGEERHARRVAKTLVAARAQESFRTTAQLAAAIRAVVPSDRSGIDAATRSFQGLRIAVNDELGEIEHGLAQALEILAPGGRLVVVSFHSLEDRIVKRAMAAAAGQEPGPSRYDPRSVARGQVQAPFRLAFRKAMRPSEAECLRNPRARSAKLRALICNGPSADGSGSDFSNAGRAANAGAPPVSSSREGTP